MRLSFAAVLCLLVISLLVGAGTGARAEVFREDFDDNQIDPTLWTAVVYGTGPSIAEVNQQLEATIPGSSSGQDFGVKLSTEFFFRGDFDVQVDFRLLQWPYGNGVRLAFGVDWGFLFPPGVERISFGQFDYPGAPRESYITDLDGSVCGFVETTDLEGALRLVRTGSTQTGYYRQGNSWVMICSGPAPAGDVSLQLSAFSAYQFMGWNVRAAFDNFVVNSGELVDDPVPARQTSWGAIKALYR
jgi:hypothetical protein